MASKELATLDRIKEIIVEQLGVDEKKVTLTANFMNDLGADSLDTVELVMAIEEEFSIDIPDDQAELIENLSQAVKFIDESIMAKKDRMKTDS